MAARKSERIVNLAICLLHTRRFVMRDEIKELIDDYRDLAPGPFERMFERDKDELRSLGVPISVGQMPETEEVGYRIVQQDFELPPIEFTPAEARVIAVAARAWDHARLAGTTTRALGKLRAAGLETGEEPLTRIMPILGAREPAFEPLWRAVVERTPVGFSYRGQRRRLEPWAVISQRGAWYVIGHDLDREAPRMFKVTRIDGEPESIGRPGAYQIPDDVDVRELAARLDPAPTTATCVVALTVGRAPTLRRGARRLDRPGPQGRELWEVPYADTATIVAEIASCGPDALVISPPEVRQAVIAQLTDIVARFEGVA